MRNLNSKRGHELLSEAEIRSVERFAVFDSLKQYGTFARLPALSPLPECVFFLSDFTTHIIRQLLSAVHVREVGSVKGVRESNSVGI
jgi:hypothetical protein